MRRALRQIFERNGLTVAEASSAREASELVGRDPSIAAVVCDFLMPELNGLAFYDELKLIAPHLCRRMVFLTGVAQEPVVHRSIEERGVPLISKLDDLQLVLDAVRLALLRDGKTG